MKLMNHREFTLLDNGVIFQELDEWGNPGTLMIRGETIYDGESNIPIDFVQAELTASHYPAMNRINWPSGLGRHALYDQGIRYLVWDKADREMLAKWLLDPKAALDDMNYDIVVIPLS